MVDPADLEWNLVHSPGEAGFWVVADFRAELRLARGLDRPIVLPPIVVVGVYPVREDAIEAADNLNLVSGMMAS